jgi:hypothetical protein
MFNPQSRFGAWCKRGITSDVKQSLRDEPFVLLHA